jgi:CheY-like chemotaxis protein
MRMGTAKIILAANSPGVLQRLKETLSGCEVHVAIRLRDVAKRVRQEEFAVFAFCLGFDEDSTMDLLDSILDEHGGPRLPIVCVVADEMPAARLRRIESRVRSAGACDFIELRNFPNTAAGNLGLRERILACVGFTVPRAITTVTRALGRAAFAAGGVVRLARLLRVEEASVRRWMRGDEPPPEAVLLAAVELVLEEIEKRGRGWPS